MTKTLVRAVWQNSIGQAKVVGKAQAGGCTWLEKTTPLLQLETNGSDSLQLMRGTSLPESDSSNIA